VMTLDNQPAFIQVGQQVPYITGIANPSNTTGTTNFQTDLLDVGIILTVIPRISPDGTVVMEIDATKSAVGPDEEGIPISIAPNGDVIRSPRIDTQRAQTTVMAASGQTVILGGLITKRLSRVHRQVPWVGDLPYVGRLFSFDSEQDERTELMIIMTPHVIRREADNDLLKQVEGARMSWCMADVYRIHGPGGPRGLGLGNGDEIPVFYPDDNPIAPEVVPSTEAPAPSVLDGGPVNGGPANGVIPNGGNIISPPVDVQPNPIRPNAIPAPDPIDQPLRLPPATEAIPQDRLPAVPMTQQRYDQDRRDEAQAEPRYDSRYAEPRDTRYETRYETPRNPAPNQVQPANFNTYEAQRDANTVRRLP
jgi:general secretion pathway protein D